MLNFAFLLGLKRLVYTENNKFVFEAFGLQKNILILIYCVSAIYLSQIILNQNNETINGSHNR